jgi:hypothetical protein
VPPAREPPPSDEAKERRERIGAVLKRLVRAGHDRKRIHRALLLGIDTRNAHGRQQMTSQQIRDHNELIRRAQTDVAHALESLRRLLPKGYKVSDDELLEMRDLVLRPLAALTARPPRGRPLADWTHATDDALRQAGVRATDRRELLAALGFVAEDT